MPALTSASFSGANYLSIANFTGNPAAFSVSCWVNLAATQLSRIFFADFLPGSNQGWAVGLSDSTNNQIKFYLGSNTLIQSGTLTTGVWAHAIFTWDGTTAKLYLNGNTTPNATLTSGVNYGSVPANNYIGSLDGTRQDLNGLLAAVGYWSKALSTTEVTSLYNSGNGLTFADLSGTLLTSLGAYYDFLNPTNLGLDSSSGAHHMSNTGGVTRLAQGPGGLLFGGAGHRGRPPRRVLSPYWARGMMAGYAFTEGYGPTVAGLTGRFPGTLVGGMKWSSGLYGPQLQAVDDGTSPGCNLTIGTVGFAGLTELTWAAFASLDALTDSPSANGFRVLMGATQISEGYPESIIFYNSVTQTIQYNARFNNYPNTIMARPPLNTPVLITGRITILGEQSLWMDSAKMFSQTLASYVYATGSDQTAIGGAVGSIDIGPASNWSGPIYAAYFWNYALTDNQIVALAADPFAPVRPAPSRLSVLAGATQQPPATASPFLLAHF